METKWDITISIVIYNPNLDILSRTLSSFDLLNRHYRIFILDNSPSCNETHYSNKKNIEYIFNNHNCGFGAGHNKIIKKILGKSSYHIILNPDVYFSEGVIEELVSFMNKNEDVGLVAPKVLYPNNHLQYSCRLLPTPFDFFIRRISFLKLIFSKRFKNQELQYTGYERMMEVPFILGCFMLVRNEVFVKVGLFDERFFMYMEDLDLSRRIHSKYKTVFYPYVNVYHVYEKGSGKSFKLFKIHLESMIKYFNKWGWTGDKEKKRINSYVLSTLK